MFSTREIRQALRLNASNQKRYMGQLLVNGFIKRRSGSSTKGFVYEVASYEEYIKLQDSISNVLDETLENIKAVVQSSKAVQKKNGLLKQKTVKALAEPVQ